ncbi:hypothetical protein NTGM5_150005 [Candidatus Nitrotoga sp. M5]|nr:hypothetical protein NTGM5_150005 [Candidatus Nitrotoga sp. M5]
MGHLAAEVTSLQARMAVFSHLEQHLRFRHNRLHTIITSMFLTKPTSFSLDLMDRSINWEIQGCTNKSITPWGGNKIRSVAMNDHFLKEIKAGLKLAFIFYSRNRLGKFDIFRASSA